MLGTFHSSENSKDLDIWYGNFLGESFQKNHSTENSTNFSIPCNVVLFTVNFGKCCSICHRKFPEIQTGIFHQMESTSYIYISDLTRRLDSYTWLTLDWQSVENWLIFDWCIWVGQHSADYQPTVDQVLIKCRSRWWSSVDRVLIRIPMECWLRCWSSVDQVSIAGINWHLTADAFSTHDPHNLMLLLF